MRRATVDDIRKHEWFQKDLQPYLFPDRDAELATLDHEAIDEVCEKFDVEASEIIKALEEEDNSNPLAIAYRLIIDNKRIADEAALEDFK